MKKGNTIWKHDVNIKDMSISVKDFGAVGDGEIDDTQAFQNTLDYCIANKYKVFIPSGTYLITDTLLLDGNKKTLIMKGNGYDSVISFNSTSTKPLFGIRNGITIGGRDIIYNNKQTMTNCILSDFKVIGDDYNSIFSKLIVWSQSTFEHIYLTHLYRVIDCGAIMYTSKMNRCDIIYINDSVFYNCSLIDSQFSQNYMSGEVQSRTENSIQYGRLSDLMKSSYFTNCDFKNNWVEFFINVFGDTSIGTRIQDNVFDFCVRIINYVSNDCKISGNRFGNYDYTTITNFIKKYMPLDPTIFTNLEFFLIRVFGGMEITNNQFYNPKYSPVYKILDYYGSNVIKETKIEGNSYIGYDYDYTKIMFPQTSSNTKITMTNSVINDGFVITDTNNFSTNTFIENVYFRYNDTILRTSKYGGNINLYNLNGSGFPGGKTVNYYVDSVNGSDSNSGDFSNVPFATINKALSIIPKIITDNIIINVANGTYNEIVSILGFNGSGSLSIIGESSLATTRNINAINIESNTVSIIVQGITIIATNTDNGIYINNCTNTTLKYCNNTVIRGTGRGVYIKNSVAFIQSNNFSNKNTAIGAINLSNVYSDTNSGSNNSYGIASSSGSRIILQGTQPSATNATATNSGGQIIQ